MSETNSGNGHRFGVVALCGPPNVGKSTLLNQIIGSKISIVSKRPQTTRHRILGIKTFDKAQLVFVDTPGLHRDQNKRLNRAINRTALNSLHEVDLIIFMLDNRGWTLAIENAFNSVAKQDAQIILLINKIDRLRDKKQLLPRIGEAKSKYPFCKIIPLSARRPKDVDSLLEIITKMMPYGPPGFPADQNTDRSERFLAAEFIREQLFRSLGSELPYACAVEIEKFKYSGDKLLKVAATIWVERESQKPIVVGRAGAQLKSIGKIARTRMEKSFGVRVYLELWVKVRSGWTDSTAALRELGYMEQ